MPTEGRRFAIILYGLVLFLGSTVMTVEWILVLPGHHLMEHLSHNQVLPETQARLLAAMPGHLPEAARQRAAGLALLGQWAEAQQQQEDWLALAPADSYGHLRLAAIARMANNTDTAARALEQSFRTGRHERELMLPRLMETIMQWNTLTPDVREMALTDLALLWRRDRPSLIKALPVDKAWPLYRRALSETADLTEAVSLRSTSQPQ